MGWLQVLFSFPAVSHRNGNSVSNISIWKWSLKKAVPLQLNKSALSAYRKESGFLVGRIITLIFGLMSYHCYLKNGELPSNSVSGKEHACQCMRCNRCGLNPWVRKIPWIRAWRPIPVILPGESPWIEDPGGLQSIGSHRVWHNWNDLACRRVET